MSNNLLEKKTVRTVINYLQNFDPNISALSLDTTARTAKDAARSLNVKNGAIVKSLIFKSSNKNLYYLCLVSGDKFISLKKLSLIINDTILKASADDVKLQTGYSIGGIPPVAHKKPPAQIMIDFNLNNYTKIFSAAGHPYVVFGSTFDQICQITNGEVCDIVQ
jgi:prolyl-tRNA editing enzyme YbaK/EbsC (Cys-tRNA(Pro) deacylase)